MKKGVLYAISAYVIWGLSPVYWKWLNTIPSAEIAAQRMIWSLVVVVVVLAARKQWQWLKPALQNKRTLLTFFATGCLVSANWAIYIWAVNAGHIVEASLGYFINPLVSVTLGMIFFRERLRLWQGVAVGIALTGVLYLAVSYGSLPWIGLSLAFTFAFYGLLKKSTRMDSVNGLFLEMAVVFLPALVYLVYLELLGTATARHVDMLTFALLIGTGVITAFPLMLFSSAAQKIPLSTVGFLFYITPSMQFFIGVLVYSEPFARDQMIGFGLVWAALLLFSIEGVATRRRAMRVRYVGTT